MPFENISHPPLKIAVIGGGISGLGAAHLLSPFNAVTLFEAEPRLGGHARTILAGKRQDVPVDSGFIVFNDLNYPKLIGLFEKLDLQISDSDMSFGVSAEDGRIEYALKTWPDLFAQKRNLMRPKFYAMLRDIVTFNKLALSHSHDLSITLGDLIKDLKLGDWFKYYYLLPFSGAIWSTPIEEMLAFPAASLARFFENHKLFSVSEQPQWKTITGGSINYVEQVALDLERRGVEMRLKSPVQSVTRHLEGAWVKTRGGQEELFDRVIFACHSDQALRILADPTPKERELLGAIRYCPNRSVMHADADVMPKRKQCWASWNYVSKTKIPKGPLGVTYWMNSLQNLPKDDLILNSLNPSHPIKEELIYDEVYFSHPVFDRAAIEAQRAFHEVQGQNHSYFCGAWLKNGFHEDGYASACEVASLLGVAAS